MSYEATPLPTAELEPVSAMAEAIASARTVPEVFRALFLFAARVTPADGIFVALYDADAGVRRCVYGASLVEGEEGPVLEEDADLSIYPEVPLNEGPQSRAIRANEPVFVPDFDAGLAGLPRVDSGSDFDERPPRSALAVPLAHAGRVIGAFDLQSTRPDAFGEAHLAPVRMAANLAAIAVRNLELLDRERAARRAADRSEALFRSIVQSGHDAVVLVDGEGNVRYESPSVRRLLGREPAARDAEEVRDLLHPDDVGDLEASARAGGGTIIYRMRHADGDWRWFEATVTDLRDDPDVEAIVLNARDVTDRMEAEAALDRTRAFRAAIIDALPGIFYLYDDEGRFVEWNRNFVHVTGRSDAELARMHPLDLFEGEDRRNVERRIADVFEHGSAHVEATLTTKGGDRIPFHFTGVRVEVGGESYLAGIGIDLREVRSAQRRIEDLNVELRERLDRITALHEIDRAITGSLDLEVTLQVALEQVTRRLDVDAACVLLHDPDDGTLRMAAGRGFREALDEDLVLKPGETPTGEIARDLRPRRALGPDAYRDAFPEHLPIAAEGFEAYLGMPLLAQGRLQGVLEIFHRAPLDPDEEWSSFLNVLSTQIAIALRSAAMVDQLERSNVELRTAYDTTIEGWARALDLRDEETEGHSRRVTELTVRLATKVGLDADEIAHVRRGALLHDIGKMGVPDAILLKPGKLNEEERATMERHPVLAHDLLAPISFLREALDIPYAHHERWDGTGYPRGLKGEAIPLAARLFALVDVYDALTSDRPYRAAWSEERALEHVRSGAGSHFDPALVPAFLELIRGRAAEDPDRPSS